MRFINFLSPNSTYGKKRRFGLAGGVNLLITNGILQFLLFFDLFPLGFCTLISQLFNLCFGYWLYGKVVFNITRSRSLGLISKYICLSSILWLLNWIGIKILYKGGANMNISALGMIIPLGVLSFVSQKYLIFKK